MGRSSELTIGRVDISLSPRTDGIADISTTYQCVRSIAKLARSIRAFLYSELGSIIKADSALSTSCAAIFLVNSIAFVSSRAI